MFCLIGAVSAADDVSTDVLTDVDDVAVVDAACDDVDYSFYNNEKILKEDDVNLDSSGLEDIDSGDSNLEELEGNFSELTNLIQNSASEDTIELSKNYTHREGENIVYCNDEKSWVINGNGFTISSEDGHGYFKLTGSITFNDVNFLNLDDGTLSISGTKLTCNNCNFTSEGKLTKALYLNTGEVYLNNCNFKNVIAESLKANYTYISNSIFSFDDNFPNMEKSIKPILDLMSNTTVISYSKFFNSKDLLSGAINLNSNNTQISDCEIVNNSAYSLKGVLSSSGIGTIKNCLFSDNDAMDCGSVVAWNNGSLNMDNCNFTNNNDENFALYFRGTALNLSNSQFLSNIQSGAIKCEENEDIILSNCLFENNSVNDSFIGAIATFNVKTLKVSNCSFINNSAVDKGGSLSIKASSSASISNSLFSYNSVLGNYSQGSAIYFEGASLNVDQSNFTYNKAFEGDVINAYANYVKVTNSQFTNNLKIVNDYYSGTLYVMADSLIVDKCQFINEQADAIKSTDAKTLITNSVFQKNLGCISLDGNKSAIKNCNFTNNEHPVNILGDYNNVSSCVFTRNHNNGFGGAIFWGGNNGIVYDSNFTYNNATTGGAISNFGTNLTVNKCTFLYNYANEGGAIDWGISGCIKNSVFKHNSAKSGDGAIDLNEGQTISRSNNTFYNNTPLYIYFTCPSEYVTTFNSGKTLTFKAIELASGKGVSGIKLKYYIESESKRWYAETNSNGVAVFKSLSKVCLSDDGDWNKIIITCDVPDKYSYDYFHDIDVHFVVNKAKTIVKAPKVVNKYKKKKYFKVTVKHKTSKKVLAGLKLKLRIYTGKKYKTYTVKTNKKGVASFNTKKLKKGNHKVVIKSASNKYIVKANSKIKIK